MLVAPLSEVGRFKLGASRELWSKRRAGCPQCLPSASLNWIGSREDRRGIAGICATSR